MRFWNFEIMFGVNMRVSVAATGCDASSDVVVPLLVIAVSSFAL